jgi:site-specific recombinase XerD
MIAPSLTSGLGLQEGTPIVTGTEALRHWLERLKKRGKAANTQKAYGVDVLDAWRSFARRDAHLVAVVGPADVERWLDDLSTRGNALRSQARKLAALKRFFAYCLEQRWCARNPCAEVGIRFRAPRIIAPELGVLLDVINRIPSGNGAKWRDVRDRALLRLALDGALRSGGLIALNVPGEREAHTVDLERLTVTTANKGGGFTDPVAINRTTANAVASWLRARAGIAAEGERAMFINASGGRLTRASLSNIARMRGKAAGIDGLYIHLFRHRRAGDLVERVGVHAARDHLQHAHTSTTVATYGAHAAAVSRKLVREHADVDAIANEPRAAA